MINNVFRLIHRLLNTNIVLTTIFNLKFVYSLMCQFSLHSNRLVYHYTRSYFHSNILLIPILFSVLNINKM